MIRMISLHKALHITLIFSLHFICSANSIGLTFELEDKATECFFENIEKNTSATLEYQVINGGQYDVDVMVESPTEEILYRQVYSQFDSYTFVANVTGAYRICFSNEFSTFSHKLLYMGLQIGEEKPLIGIAEQATVMTQMELTFQDIHKHLNKIIDHQTHLRLKEVQSRKRAEDLNNRVALWSVFIGITIEVVGIGQVFILKRFFTDKTSSQWYNNFIIPNTY